MSDLIERRARLSRLGGWDEALAIIDNQTAEIAELRTALAATAEAAATHLKNKIAADATQAAEIARLKGLLCSQTIIAALVQGLHAQVFGVRSLGDPQLSHDALADNGQLHEAVHALVEALPPREALENEP